MNDIKSQLNRVGSLRDINQAVRLISNLGGTVFAVNGLVIDYLDGDSCYIANFNHLGSGRIVLTD